MKRVFLASIALFSMLSGKSQQDAQFSQNMFLNQSINPGATGIKDMHCFDMVGRNQWMGFEGAPFTGLLSYNGPIPSMGNMGMGVVLVYDKIGFESNVGAKLSYAYHLQVGSNGAKLGLGLDLGIINKGFSGNVVAGNMTDAVVTDLQTKPSATALDLGFGAFYYQPNKLYFGISGLKLLPQTFSFASATEPPMRSHVYITAGYQYALNADFDLKPNVLVKTDLSATQLDFNLTAEYKKQIWLGASYRMQDAIVANVGYNVPLGKNSKGANLNPLKVGLAYDFTTQGLKNKGVFTFFDENGNSIEPTRNNNRSVGSVEIYLGYCFVQPPKPNFDLYVDPLFL